MELQQLLSNIPQPNMDAAATARSRWDALFNPPYGLGALEEAVVRIAALTDDAVPELRRRSLLVFCADHATERHGLTRRRDDATAAEARALASGENPLNIMARSVSCRVQPVDMGIWDFAGCKGLVSCRIRNGTGDITRGPAMSREECLSAIRAGAGLAMVQEADILAVGQIGKGSETAAETVAAVMMDLPAASVTGWGAGLSRAALSKKTERIDRAIAVNRPDASDPLDVLTKVGGLNLAASCGAFLGAAACRRPVLIDGVASAAAALCALRLSPSAGAVMLASQLSPEPVGALLLEAIGLQPLLSADLSLEGGCGAVAALPLLDMALAVYREGLPLDRSRE